VRAQRSQRRFASSIVGFTSGGYDICHLAKNNGFPSLIAKPRHQHVIDNDIKQTNLIAF
jgi:hypothetical protein